jgi:hypothetical protein
MMATRPACTTLTQVRNLFWGWHLLPANLKWRYFSTLPDFGSTLTELQRAACQPWYDHQYEGNAMSTVCFEMRKLLQTNHVDFNCYEQVDAIFVSMFAQVYHDVLAAGVVHDLRPPPHTVPVEQLNSWDSRNAAFNEHANFFDDWQDAQEDLLAAEGSEQELDDDEAHGYDTTDGFVIPG